MFIVIGYEEKNVKEMMEAIGLKIVPTFLNILYLQPFAMGW